ncbi:b(0,+)-type amino acid transporter 1-like isoform X2 [Mercenaria mercenaria]|uniref:b(0,+)-type amino acid transporter 1-like isoform X1 n=1 Tax=Mercenaria mercenaria TaxID=6596 RepID=UPI00234EEAF3|nr:b(0,+)-type amino acid transporter 1-like isoform X1 [Mercenaria mercenaria]XP_053401453.1 b(0,+)-type amino acid transporter 1-like isoform X1 [Mercenaria mercenaria]XP_053401454.1 b(0,+)-type amino acid transporter 1-like isoform X2 [Mercenaria mercenaria]
MSSLEKNGNVNGEAKGLYSSNGQLDSTDGKAEMKKSVGLFSGTALIVGTMIGSGIFISPKGVLEGTGSVGFSLIIWVACGLLSMLGALAYAELGTCVPRSGGEHAYLMYTFGSGTRRIGTVVAFLFDWVGLFILRPIMFSVMTLSLGTYVVKPFFPTCTEPPMYIVKLCTVLAMLILGAINVFSVKMATYLQNVTTITKLVALAIITIGGIYKICSGETEYIASGFEDTREDLSLISIAFYNGLWAYDGWNNLNFITEELKEPEKNLPRSILIGIPLTTLAYLLANVGYFAVMSKEEILLSHAVAVTWSTYMLGVMSWLMPVFVVLSCIGSANGCLFATGRLCFAAARDNHFPKVLSFIQVTRFTPMAAIVFTVIVSMITLIPGDLSTLIDFYSFCIWVGYGATMVALLVLRYKEPTLHRPYKVPIFIPIFVFIMSIYLTVSPIVQTGRITFFYAVLFIFSGLFVYFPFIYYNLKVPYLDRGYRFIQILFQLVPPHTS